MKTIVIVASLLMACPARYAAAAPPERSTLTGMVTDETGKPLAGVRVDISTAAPKVGPGMFCPSCYLDCSKWAKTNNAGEFKMESLDPKLKFRLIAASPGLRTQQSELIDPLAGPVTLALTTLPKDLDPGRIVTGIITSEQGVPIPGAFVEPYGAKTATKRWWGTVEVDSVVSDDKGQFAMILPTDLLALVIEVLADGFCGTQVYSLEPGKESANIEVPTGASVVGKLVHKGQPVAGMSIAVVQTNRSVGQDRGIFIKAVGDVTRDDGSFEFKYLPPNQQYAIFAVAGESREADRQFVVSTKLFKVPESGETRDLGNLEVTNPASVSGKVLRVDGQPLPANLQQSFGRNPAWDLIGIPVAEDGTFAATGLPPETYEIRVSSRDLVIVADEIPYQMMSESSFSVYVTEPIDDLVIPVKAK